jgi:hypothetical protein
MAENLNNVTKAYLKEAIGLSYSELIDKDVEQIDKHIEKSIGKKLVNQSRIGSFMSRGNVYLYLERFLDLRYFNKIFSKI